MNFFEVLRQVSLIGLMPMTVGSEGQQRADGDNGFGVDVAHAALVALFCEQCRLLAQRREEGTVAVMGELFEKSRIGAPNAAVKIVPCVVQPFFGAPERVNKKATASR